MKVHFDRIEFRAACDNIIFSLMFLLAGFRCMSIFFLFGNAPKTYLSNTVPVYGGYGAETKRLNSNFI
ncbi:MAG: hypothetical protein D3923_07910 [Candidatus Electrothrix sp. AR3]|nr:hypothetical protein [Candidatus Electrothrix sp. AR3]